MSNKPLTKPDASKPLPLTPVDSPHKYFPASYVFCVCLKPVSKYFSQSKRNNSLHKYFRCTLFSCLTLSRRLNYRGIHRQQVMTSAQRVPFGVTSSAFAAVTMTARNRGKLTATSKRSGASINILCPSIYVFYSHKISIDVHTFPALTSVQSCQDV